MQYMSGPTPPAEFKVDLDGSGKEGRLVYSPSTPYLHDLLIEELGRDRDYRAQHLATLSLEVGKFDHSFKFAKHVKLSDGTKAHAAVATLMNEHQQVGVG